MSYPRILGGSDGLHDTLQLVQQQYFFAGVGLRGVWKRWQNALADDSHCHGRVGACMCVGVDVALVGAGGREDVSPKKWLQTIRV